MTDPTPTAPNGRGLSRFLWVSGAVLWGIVGVMALTFYFRGPKPDSASVASDGPAAALDGPAGTQKVGAGEAGAAGGLVEPTAMWDADGIADFRLTERSGDEVTKQTLLGKPWVVGFVFTRCAGPCPRVTGQMRKLQDQLKEDVRLVTMTVDPDYDTPEILARYADAFGAEEDRWLFLTGDKEEMYRYIEKNFKMPVQEMQGEDRKPGFEVLHTTNLLLVDAKGVVRGKYNALIPEELAKLKLDLKKLDG